MQHTQIVEFARLQCLVSRLSKNAAVLNVAGQTRNPAVTLRVSII